MENPHANNSTKATILRTPSEPDLETWRTAALHIINDRRQEYPSRPELFIRDLFHVVSAWPVVRALRRLFGILWPFHAADRRDSNRSPTALVRSLTSASTRVSSIPELVENILQFADSHTLVHTAWSVSPLWRATVRRIIAHAKGPQSFRTPYPCAAVEKLCFVSDPNMDNFDRINSWLQPSSEEVEVFSKVLDVHLHQIRTKDVSNLWILYPPPRITMAASRGKYDLNPDEADRSLASKFDARLDEIFRFWQFVGQNTSLHWIFVPTQWYDFSLFSFNPYIGALFSGRMTVLNGVCKIKLRPALNSYELLLPDLPQLDVLLRDIGSTFATQPPCKSIDIYLPAPLWLKDFKKLYMSELYLHGKTRYLLHLETIRSHDGIRCRQLLDALQNHTGKTFRHWLNQSKRLEEEVYKISSFDDDVWSLPGSPTFYLKLGRPSDHTGWLISGMPMGDMINEPRLERQREWLPKEMIHEEE